MTEDIDIERTIKYVEQSTSCTAGSKTIMLHLDVLA